MKIKVRRLCISTYFCSALIPPVWPQTFRCCSTISANHLFNRTPGIHGCTISPWSWLHVSWVLVLPHPLLDGWATFKVIHWKSTVWEMLLWRKDHTTPTPPPTLPPYWSFHGQWSCSKRIPYQYNQIQLCFCLYFTWCWDRLWHQWMFQSRSMGIQDPWTTATSFWCLRGWGWSITIVLPALPLWPQGSPWALNEVQQSATTWHYGNAPAVTAYYKSVCKNLSTCISGPQKLWHGFKCLSPPSSHAREWSPMIQPTHSSYSNEWLPM